jgi:hypothetical protein
LTQTFTAHCNAMICQQVTLSGDAEWPKVADAVIEARQSAIPPPVMRDNPCYRRQSPTLLLSRRRIRGVVRHQKEC